MKYFLVQALASSIFFFSIILLMISNNLIRERVYSRSFNLIILNSSLLLKMGAAPFHFWFPEIIEGLRWINSLILITWQKIAPIILLSYSLKTTRIILFIIASCSIVGRIGGLNQTSLRKIIAFSSINHIGWIIASFLKNEIIWLIYFAIYSIISSTIILLMNSFKVFHLKQIFTLINGNILVKFRFIINLLSLGGLPPFLGFFPKWIIIQHLRTNYRLILLIIIIMTLITLFFYLRIAYTSLVINHNEMNFIKTKTNVSKSNMFISFMSIIGLTICTLIFNLH